MLSNDHIKADGLMLGKAEDVADFALAKRLTEVLMKHYPGHLWGVNVMSEQGMATVRNFSLSGDWGFYLTLATINNDPDDKAVIRAGGEILERFSMSRGALRGQELEDLPTDFAGRHKVDIVGAQNV